MRQLLAPILFDDDDRAQAQAVRASIVAPAQRSASAKLKALTKQTADGLKVHSFQTLMGVALLDLRLPGYEGSFAGARTPMTFLPS